MRDVEVIELELALADLQQVEKRMERAGKDKKTGGGPRPGKHLGAFGRSRRLAGRRVVYVAGFNFKQNRLRCRMPDAILSSTDRAQARARPRSWTR